MTAPAVVILAEDEALLRLDASDMLDAAGYCILEAATADQAAELLRTRAEVQVLVTDVSMPGKLDGFGLARLARTVHPFVGIVIMSGRDAPDAGELPAGTAFLMKPFSQEGLLKAVRMVLPEIWSARDAAATAASGSPAHSGPPRLAADAGARGEMAQPSKRPPEG